jgi:L-lactate dehydrogenase complex protein LldG
MSATLSARNSILARLRAAPIADAPATPDVQAWSASHRRDEDPVQRVSRLRKALEAAHAEVHDTTPNDWAALLLNLAVAKNVRRLLVGADTPHGATLQACRPEGLELLRYERPIAAWRDALFDAIDASLTLARSAIADTGSLVLWPSASEPRLMSLVPPVHFVLLDATRIHADLQSAMSAEAWTHGMPTNALLVSGPSKTADIQQTMAYGAHGPRELVVLMIHAEGACA